jgi:hypothetical protein
MQRGGWTGGGRSDLLYDTQLNHDTALTGYEYYHDDTWMVGTGYGEMDGGRGVNNVKTANVIWKWERDCRGYPQRDYCWKCHLKKKRKVERLYQLDTSYAER